MVAGDLAGNYANQTIFFMIDTTAPTLSITSPENSTYSNGSIVLTYTISDFSSFTTLVYVDGGINASLRNSGYHYSLADGNHNITIVVTDSVGNSNPSSSDSTQSLSSSQSQSNSSNQLDTSNTLSTTTPGFNIFGIMVCSIILLFYQISKRTIKKNR